VGGGEVGGGEVTLTGRATGTIVRDVTKNTIPAIRTKTGAKMLHGARNHRLTSFGDNRSRF
jgi:hypothetical protein